MAGQRHNAAFVVGAIVGGLAGTTYALVTAPQAGAQTRAQLKERLQALTDRAAQTIERVRAEGGQLVERVVASIAAFANEELEQEHAIPTPRPGERMAMPTGTDEVIEIPEPGEPSAEIVGPAGELGGNIAPPKGSRPPHGVGTDIVIDGPRPTMTDH